MNNIQGLSVRSILVIMLVAGGFGIAIIDPQFRVSFADIAKIGIAGYLGQMHPQKK